MTVRWGITGAGRYASLVTAPAITSTAGSKLVAVSDVSIELAGSLAGKHGVEKTYDSFEKMLQDPDVDAVYIATPHNIHAAYAMQAARAGKHVFCEKPMALTVADAERMTETCEKNKVKLGVSFPERFQPAHLEARRYIQSGVAGRIDVVQAQFCRGGTTRGDWRGWRKDPEITGAGALYATALHPLDLLRFLLDSEIVEVRTLTDEAPPQYPLESMVYVIARFANGANGAIVSGTLAPRSETSVVLYGTKAKITLRETIWGMQQKDLGELLIDGDSVNLSMTFPTDNPVFSRMAGEIEAFNKWIQEDIEPAISGCNGLQMVKIANAILESSRHGKAVKISG